MPRQFFRRLSRAYARNRESDAWYLRPFRTLLEHPSFVAVSRRAVAGGLWVGLFMALLPLPGQTLLVVFAALALRVNVPLAAISVWVTNPLTMVPIYYWEYRLGTLILDTPLQRVSIEPSWSFVAEGLAEAWRPLLLGSFVTATVVASATYVAVSVVWRATVTARYRRRRALAR